MKEKLKKVIKRIIYIAIPTIALLIAFSVFIYDKLFCFYPGWQIQAIIIQMNALEANLKQFNKTCSRFPTEAEGLQALIEKPQTLDCPNYPKEGFLIDGVIPLDPWDKNYVYKLEEGNPVLYSSGEDQEMGTDDDISSKPPHYDREIYE